MSNTGTDGSERAEDAGADTRAPLPATVTMPLLDRITRQALDEEYQQVAALRESEAIAAGEAPPSGDDVRRSELRSPLTIVAVLVFGLLVSIAAVQTEREEDVHEAGRQLLISRIEERQEVVSDLAARVNDLNDDVVRAESEYAELGRELGDLEARNQQLAEEAGFTIRSGSGVRISVDNAPGATFANGSPGLVQHGDLAELVNGLWEAGASAIAVDGQRMTALSAFSNSASVVRVNGVSLSPPYDVVALGDTRTLLAEFARTVSGQTFRQLTEQLQMPVTTQNSEDLTVPAAPESMLNLAHARVLGQSDSSDKGSGAGAGDGREGEGS